MQLTQATVVDNDVTIEMKRLDDCYASFTGYVSVSILPVGIPMKYETLCSHPFTDDENEIWLFTHLIFRLVYRREMEWGDKSVHSYLEVLLRPKQ